MVTMHGSGVYQRIVMGNVSFLDDDKLDFSSTTIVDTEKEVLRFKHAHIESLKIVQYLYTRALTKTSRSNTKVFQSYLAILEDKLCIQTAIKMIEEESMCAEQAIIATSERISEMFLSIENEYMHSQAVDVKDVAKLIIKNLLYDFVDLPIIRRSSIVCAEELSPTDVIELGCRRVQALVVANTSSNDYVSSVCRTMAIPTIMGVGKGILDDSYKNKLAIVDSYSGTLYINPTEDTIVNITRMVATCN